MLKFFCDKCGNEYAPAANTPKLDGLLVEVVQFIANAEKQRLADAETITALTIKFNALEQKYNIAARIKAGAEKQLFADSKDDPEYLMRVERRERLRMGK